MLYGPAGDVASAPEWRDLARKLVEGDGLGWPGDPRLYLQVLVATETDSTTGRKRTGRLLEVRRENEDGSDTPIGHWRPDEQMRVCYDLAQMRLESPGHVSAVEAIDQHNDRLQEEASEEARGKLFEVLEHALKLHHDRHNPRNTFFMNGAGNRGGRA